MLLSKSDDSPGLRKGLNVGPRLSIRSAWHRACPLTLLAMTSRPRSHWKLRAVRAGVWSFWHGFSEIIFMLILHLDSIASAALSLPYVLIHDLSDAIGH